MIHDQSSIGVVGLSFFINFLNGFFFLELSLILLNWSDLLFKKKKKNRFWVICHPFELG